MIRISIMRLKRIAIGSESETISVLSMIRISIMRLKQLSFNFPSFGSVTINDKNLNYEIETLVEFITSSSRYISINDKNLNYEIETIVAVVGNHVRDDLSMIRISIMRLKLGSNAPSHAQVSPMNYKNLKYEIETGSQRLRIEMPTPLSIRRFSEPVLKSRKLSQSAVDLSIHSELQRRTEVGGSQPIGLGDQAPTIDLTQFANYRENMPLNSVGPSGFRKKPSFEEKTRFLC